MGVHAASKYVYAIGLGCKAEEIYAKWEHALANLVEPVIISEGPVHEEIHMGKVAKIGISGLEAF